MHSLRYFVGRLMQSALVKTNHPPPANVPSIRRSSTRESRTLRKLVSGKIKAKRRWYQDEPNAPKMQSMASLSDPKRQGKNAPRRVHVLNKLFMEHITDLLATGQMADRIVGRGLQISHVKVSADFNYLNVFWSAVRSSNDASSATDDLAIVLQQIAGPIRHELSQMCLMGVVPRINFVHSPEMSTDAVLDDLLARADYGDDFEPHNWAQLRRDLSEHGDGQSNDSVQLPEMRHDVLGLNQAEIMAKIRQTMSKSRQAWDRYEAGIRPSPEANAIGEPESSGSPTHCPEQLTVDTRIRAEEFTKFLEQRRHSRRLRTVKRNPDFNEPYHREEYDEDDSLYERFDQRDYIEDDEPPMK